MKHNICGIKWAAWAGIAIAFPSWSVAETKGITPQVISLPSGAGSIEGYGESFEPQLNTGTFTFSVPFNLPTVRGDVGPSFSLNYNSANGNGCVGMGWKLSIPYIQLQTDKGLPRYEGGDSFIDASGEELVLTQDGTYRVENEGSFRKFEKILLSADPDGPIGWRVHLPNGVVYNYGMTAQSRLDLPADRVPVGGNGTFCWMLESAEDTNGNRAEYTYFKEEVRDGEGVLVGEEIYCEKIIYGLHRDLHSEVFEVRFAYEGGRVDPIMDFRPRFCRETRLRLNTISAHHGARRIRLWRLEYQDDCPVTLLKSFTGFGDERSRTDGNAQLNQDFLPAMEFDYTPCRIGDVWVLESVADAPPVLLDNGEAVFVDIDQDSLPDILHEQNGELRSYLNLGRGMEWGDANIFASVPGGFQLASATTRLADMRGNASVDVLWNRGVGLSEYSYFSFASPAAFDLGDGDGTPWDTQVPINAPNVQLVDINFDKAIDIMQTDGQNGFCYVINGQVEGGANSFIDDVPSQAEDLGVQFSDGWQFADVNGDRLQDLVKLQTQEDGGGILVHYNSGWGGFEKRLIMTGGPIGSEVNIEELHLSDINQDGLSDCIQVREGLVRIWLNKDSRSWDVPILIESEDLHVYPDTAIRFVDINGNGSSDIVLSSIDNEAEVPMQFLELQPEGKPYQMNAMQNGIGRTLQIEYRDAVEYYLEAKETATPDDDWDSVIPFNLPVVGAFVESDGLGGVYRTEFSYRNGFYDAKEKELRGFERATKREIGDATSPTLVTQFEFFTGEQQEALKGMTKTTQTETEAGQVFSRTSNDWVARPLGLEAVGEDPITYAYVEREVTDVIEKGSGTPVMLEKLYEYDDYGNKTKSTDFGRVENGDRAAWDDERVTVGGFTAAHPSGIANWILNLQVWQEIQDENGVPIARTEHYYDDQSFAAGDPGSVSAGNLTLTRAFIDPAAGTFVNSTRNEYNGYGNITGIYDPLGQVGDASAGHFRQVVYDATIHSYPIRETVHTANPLPGAPKMLVVEADYDFGLGVVSASRDPNGHQTSYGHDTFGRQVSIVKPGDSIAAPTTEFDYVLAVPLPGDALINYVETRQRESAGGGTIDSRTYSDGLGRKIMTRSEGEDPGQIVVTDTIQFNARRGDWKKYLPYFDGGGLGFVDPSFQSGFLESHYDAQGRVLQTFQPLLAGAGAREFSQISYLPLEMQTSDEEQTKPGSAHFGAYLSANYDGLSGAENEPRVRYSDQYVKISDAGEVTGSLVPWRTEYVYDLLNNVTQITDSQGNIKWARFDGLSRKTWIDDPDRGQLTTVYDDASNVLETTDAKNQWIRYTYDGANRALTEDYSDTPTGPADVRYHFDVAAGALADGSGNQRTAGNLLGVLAYVQDLSGEEHQSYDERGRLSWQIKRIKPFGAGELRNFFTGYQYDSADRQALISYPDGDAVSYTYDTRGTLDTVVSTSTGPLIRGCDYISSGKFAAKRYGNGVVTDYQYDNRLRLIDLETESPAERLLDYNYTLDGVSNIAAIADERPGGSELENSQNFLYDDSYRLLQVRYPESGADELNYRYDRIGNIVSKRSNIVHLDRGNSVTDLGVMGYGSNAGAWNRNGINETEGLPGPGAVTNVEDGGRSYSYDANGNMATIEGMICEWDVKDRLAGTTRDGTTSNYTYDYTDRRIGKSTGSLGADPSDRFYVNQFYEVEGTNDTKYFFAGAERVAKLEGSAAEEDRQTVELRGGWNLFVLRIGGVSGSDLFTGGAAGVVAYSLNLTTGDYLEIAANTALSPGSIIWIWTPEAGSLDLVGTAPVEAPPAWNGEPGLFASTSLEPVSFESTSFFLSRYVATEQRWHAKIEEKTEVSPGEVVRLERKEGEGWPSSASAVTPALAFYHSDHLGSTSIQTDAAGMANARSINYPYGWERASAGGGEIRYGFTGKEQDGETDLHYFEARYYAAHLGRFICVDPSLEEGGLNVYSYTENNPVTFIDPDGLDKLLPDWVHYIGTGVGAVVSYASDAASVAPTAVAVPFVAINVVDGYNEGSGEYFEPGQEGAMYEGFKGMVAIEAGVAFGPPGIILGLTVAFSDPIGTAIGENAAEPIVMALRYRDDTSRSARHMDLRENGRAREKKYADFIESDVGRHALKEDEAQQSLPRSERDQASE